ncbi:hypothetical protein G3I38_24390 [Streptomyces sp. SID7958]|uniref:Uncharacterized protein n=2 Tax=unclassified Streptomyces TaxID=2593676 RepID=A0A6G3QWR7_9ACTN|nr:MULTISPECIES: hypothetical protein [unclassified Streptomyces]NEA87949.1 hypothetical protein [Streptomyces sp. SID14436]NEC82296.1 hypothetical protein [Streptomyces sp. SID7958]
MLRKQGTTILGATALVLAGVVGGAAPVQAAPVQITAGGTAPACIQRSVVNNPDGGMQAWLYNKCGKTMRVKVVVKNWRDTSCKSIKNKQSAYFRTVGGRYDRTAVC